jgi:hypothetical protein
MMIGWETSRASWVMGLVWDCQFGLIDEFYDAPIKGFWFGPFFIHRQGY